VLNFSQPSNYQRQTRIRRASRNARVSSSPPILPLGDWETSVHIEPPHTQCAFSVRPFE
jgi:hypothetical protein